MTDLPFTSQPGRLFDCVEDAQRAIECHPNLFPAGYLYRVEIVRKSSDHGRTVMEMAQIVAVDAVDLGKFVGYGRNPEENYT
jgi:hypothetical protein